MLVSGPVPRLIDGGTGRDFLSLIGRLGVRLNLEKGFLRVASVGSGRLRSIEDAFGGSGADTIVGSHGPNVLEGNQGKDRLFGLKGNDRLEGNQADDRLDGGPGDDFLIGGEDTDVCINGERTLRCERKR